MTPDRAVFYLQRKHSLDAADGFLAALAVHGLAQRTGVLAGLFGPRQQLEDAGRDLLAAVLVQDAAPAPRWRQWSRSSWPVAGSSRRTHCESHWTFTARPIHWGGALW